MNPATTIYLAAAAADERGMVAAPAAILVRTHAAFAACEIVEIGPPERVAAHPESRGATTIELPGEILLPALVNAHAHLDLTSVGPIPYHKEDGFAGWIDSVRRRRLTSETEIRASMRIGIEKSLAGAVVAVGDIAGGRTRAPLEELRASPLTGVSYQECFGFGDAAETIAFIDAIIAEDEPRAGGVALGVQPHSPYSAGRALFRRAAEWAKSGIPVCTHLAESRSERDCVVRGEGPIRDFLASLGLWEAARSEFGRASSPVQHLREPLEGAPWVVAHVNECSDDDLDLLVRTGAVVVFCPRASAYFQHEQDFGPHRYLDMIARGVTVALGTDSIICHPPESSARISTFDEMRFLWERDLADPFILLRMATTAGAAALGLSPDLFRLSVGPIAGLASMPLGPGDADRPLERALAHGGVPTLLWNRGYSR